MKYQVVILQLILFSFKGFTQTNNPFNQRGLDYVNSINLVMKDYNSGAIKSVNEKTIKYYSEKASLKNMLPVDVAASTFKSVQSGKTTLSSIVDNSEVSAETKKITKEIVFNPLNLSDAEFKNFLVRKNNDIQRSAVSASEKEVLFTLSAIAYSVRDGQISSRNNSSGCLVKTEEGSGYMSNSGCVAACAVLGFYLGFRVCGFWCGLGGAIIGGVAGSIALS